MKILVLPLFLVFAFLAVPYLICKALRDAVKFLLIFFLARFYGFKRERAAIEKILRLEYSHLSVFEIAKNLPHCFRDAKYRGVSFNDTKQLIRGRFY